MPSTVAGRTRPTTSASRVHVTVDRPGLPGQPPLIYALPRRAGQTPDDVAARAAATFGSPARVATADDLTRHRVYWDAYNDYVDALMADRTDPQDGIDTRASRVAAHALAAHALSGFVG